MGSEIRKPYHLQSRQMAAILSKASLMPLGINATWICIYHNPDKNVQILDGLVFKWLGLWLWSLLKPDHLKTGPFEI